MGFMTPEFFGTILKPKLVDGREVVAVAHNARTLESCIDGTDDSGLFGSMWNMDQADPNLRVALANLEAIMAKMGWVIEDEGWRSVDEGGVLDDIYVADFLRISLGDTGSLPRDTIIRADGGW